MKQNFTHLSAFIRTPFLSLLFLFATIVSVNAQVLPINYTFNSAPLPAGLSSNGTLSTSGSIGSCTACSQGRLEVSIGGYLQIDVPALSTLNLNMKSAGASSRTVTVKYKKGSAADYTTAGTVSVPQAGNSFILATQFPDLVTSSTISVRLENAASGGTFHIHDILVEGAAVASSEAEITGFQLSGQVGNSTITSAQGRIELIVPVGTNLSNAIPSVLTLSTGATINPTATTPRDFSGGAEVPYTVTAQDGSTTKNWVVKVTEQQSDEKEITGFVLSSEQIGNSVINSAAGTITVSVPNTLAITNLVPQTITVSANANITPAANTARNFSSPLVYTVTAQNGTIKEWTVSVTVVDPGLTYSDYEAEEADYTGTVDNNHSGFTGTGFVNFLSAGENYIIFNVCQTTAGTQTAKFRYAIGVADDRKGNLYVNDVFVKVLDFAATGAWTTWNEEVATVSLQAGMNAIKITWDSTDGPNLDKLLLSGAKCASYTLTANVTNGGTITLSPNRFGNRYFDVETVTLLAIAQPNLQFNNWSGDLTGSVNPAQLQMNSNKTITANFTVIPTYTLQVTTNGIGQVVLNPAGGVYAAGTVVTLTANTALGSSFQGWSGDASGSNTVTTVTMDANKSVTAAFSNSTSINFDTPVGFASVNTGSTYPNFNGPTTGGQNAVDTFWVRSPADFDSLAWHLYYRNRAYNTGTIQNGVTKAPKVIVFKEGVYPEGTSSSSAWGNSMMTIQEQGDLTIIGEKNVVLKFGFNIKRSWNIIIRNINFQDYYDDGINIGETETHHIWIDHCTLGHPTTLPVNTEHPDGGIDSKSGASYITVSWCLIRNSWKTSLVGHSDNNGSEDNGRLKVTYFANHFVGTNSRNPRVRFGEVHVLNNLSERVNLYGIAAANGAKVVAEGNFYLNTRWPMYADRTVADFRAVFGNNTDNVFTSKTGNIPATYLKQFNNDYDDSGLPVITAQINPAKLNPGGRSVKFDEFNPQLAFDPTSYYTYTPFSPAVVRTVVPLFAGADKVNFFGQAVTTGPTISTTGTVTAFSQVIGAPSAEQTYTVAATELTDNLVITPPASFQVSADAGVTWFSNANPLTLTQTGGVIASTTIRVRLNATAIGAYSGNITHTSAGATTVNIAVTGNTVQPAASDKLIRWPLTVNNTDEATERNAGVEATAPTFTNLYVSNGTTVATVPAYSELHGQAFGTDAGGQGLWGTAAGGPGGTLRRIYYEEFTIKGKAGYTVKVDSLILNAAFHNTSSGTNLGIVFSKSNFVVDSTDISGGGIGPDGALTATAGAFGTPIALKNRTTAGNPDNYRLAIAGATGVTLQEGETLTVRLYFSCGSSSSGRYGKLKDLYFIGSANSGTPQPIITVSAAFNPFSQTVGSPSATQTYTVSGTSLSGNVTITPPVGYEVSADAGTTWFTNASPLILTPAGASLAATTVSIRLNSNSAGTFNGNIVHTSTDASTINTAISGTVIGSGVPIGTNVVVAKDGSGNFTTIQAAIDAAPTGLTTPYIIYIKNGKYVEKVLIPANKPFIQLIGESAAHTVLSWGDGASMPAQGGGTIGTFNSYTLFVAANDVALLNLTIENTFGNGSQAVALRADGDRIVVKGCRLLGNQDTMLNNSNTGGKQYFVNTYIDGNVDYIFGSARVILDSCVIYSKDRTNAGNSYITAANTQAGQPYGYVFRDCILPPNLGATNYFLGRPWQNSTGANPVANNKTVFINTTMSSSILPAGWSTWDAGTNTSLINYAEYKSKKFDGSLVDVSARVPWSFQLTDGEAATYNNANLFDGWNPCSAGAAFCENRAAEIAVANFRGKKEAANAVFNWNISWAKADIKYELFRSASLNGSYVKVSETIAANDTTYNFQLTDALPALGTSNYYYVIASKTGFTDYTTDTIEISRQPNIIITGTTQPFQQAVGSPSSSQNVTVAGEDLQADIVLTVPEHYEISSDAGNSWTAFPGTLTLTAANNAVPNTSIAIRLNAASAGTYTDSIELTTLNGTMSYISVTGVANSPNTSPIVVLQHWPFTTSGQDSAAIRSIGVLPSAPSFKNLYLSNGTQVAFIPAYSPQFGQAFGPGANGVGNWGTSAGGPGGNLNRNFYQEFTITARNGFNVRVDSIITTAAFYNTASSTRLGLVYSRSGFMNDSANISAVPGSFASPVLLANQTTGPTNVYRLALNGIDGISLQPGETLTLRLYFSCSSSSAGRYAMLKDVMLVGEPTLAGPPPTIDTANASLQPFLQNSGNPSAIQSYTLSANNLLEDLIVTPPVGFELSANGINWFSNTNPLVLAPVNGSVAPVNISVRLNSAVTGLYSGTIEHSSLVATTVHVPVTGEVAIVETINVTAALSNFNQTVGTPSATQTFTVNGENLTEGISITAPAGYELSANGGTSWVSNGSTLVLPQTNGVVANTVITLRLNAATAGTYNGNIANASAGAATINVPITGVVVNPPAINLVAGLFPFSQTIGTPSGVQVFTVGGSDVTGPITITAPANYELSLNNINWFQAAAPIVLTPTAGNIAATPIRIRLNAAGIGERNGTISVQTTGTATQQIAVTGYTYPILKLAPNPASDIITFYHPFVFSTAEITIVDSKGLVVRRMRTAAAAGNTQINISLLPAGIYTLKFHNGPQQTLLFRFVKL